jgi:hypothetical protein
MLTGWVRVNAQMLGGTGDRGARRSRIRG